jgi:DNA invertase Pin-like site-specific DNA recombinase
MLFVMGAFVEFERALIGERQRESVRRIGGARKHSHRTELLSFGSASRAVSRKRSWRENLVSAAKRSIRG